MRKFNYIEDYRILSSSVYGYIKQLSYEIGLMNEQEPNVIYEKALNLLDAFNKKYPDLYALEQQILDDLLLPDNVEYAFKHKKYPQDASKIGMELEQDLKDIFELEEQLKQVALNKWKMLTPFEDIQNGERFITVGHASYLVPGTLNTETINFYRTLYLSCSLFSDKELNTFSNFKTVYLIDVNEDNYIASSYIDSVTADFDSSQFETLKEIDINGETHYIKVGYTFLNKEKAVTTISTPELIEKLSVERELKQNGTLYDYTDALTNEIVLDRTKSKVTGALLISDGCDLLLEEYRTLKESNIRFKCINKGLYRRKKHLKEYSEEEYSKLVTSLNQLLLNGYYDVDFLKEYYDEVVIPMCYSESVKNIIQSAFEEYYDRYSRKEKDKIK